MSDETDIAAIEAALAKPQSQSADGVSESNRPLPDVIAADKYKRALQAQAAGAVGPTFRQIVPSGAIR